MFDQEEKTEDEKYQDRLDEMINECWASLLTTEGGRLLFCLLYTSDAADE